MISTTFPLPTQDESRERKQALGQFLTPIETAEFMASFFSALPSTIKLIDAGAGAGALTLSLVSKAILPKSGVKSIEVTAYELDQEIIPELQQTLGQCKDLCESSGIDFRAQVHHTDFILETVKEISENLLQKKPSTYNVAIANPPYKKIGVNSLERKALSSIGLDATNLYSGFISLITRLLDEGGELVAITPRSFCNGPYFKSFREDFLQHMSRLFVKDWGHEA